MSSPERCPAVGQEMTVTAPKAFFAFCRARYRKANKSTAFRNTLFAECCACALGKRIAAGRSLSPHAGINSAEGLPVNVRVEALATSAASPTPSLPHEGGGGVAEGYDRGAAAVKRPRKRRLPKAKAAVPGRFSPAELDWLRRMRPKYSPAVLDAAFALQFGRQ